MHVTEELYGNRQGCARLIKFAAFIIGFLIGICICVCLSSCSTPKTVTRTEYRDRHKTDTVQVVDSFYRYRFVWLRGDTIYVHDSIDRWRTKDRVIREYVHDSIDRPIEIEKPKSGFEKAVYGSGYVLWGLIIIAILIGIIKLLIRFRLL